MAASTVEEYQGVLREMLALRQQIEKMAKTIAQGAAAVRDWKRMHVLHTKHTFPSVLATDPQCPAIDGQKWPSADQIASTLSKYHELLTKAKMVWNNLPEDLRVGFQKPEEY